MLYVEGAIAFLYLWFLIAPHSLVHRHPVSTPMGLSYLLFFAMLLALQSGSLFSNAGLLRAGAGHLLRTWVPLRALYLLLTVASFVGLFASGFHALLGYISFVGVTLGEGFLSVEWFLWKRALDEHLQSKEYYNKMEDDTA